MYLLEELQFNAQHAEERESQKRDDALREMLGSDATEPRDQADVERAMVEIRANFVLERMHKRALFEAGNGNRHLVLYRFDESELMDRNLVPCGEPHYFCTADMLKGAARIIFDRTAKMRLNPTIEWQEDCLSRKGFWSIIIRW